MYDAIIVGARCAGSPTAMLLARAGYRVLLVDQARFPSDTLSTHYVQPDGSAALQRWGLLDRVLAAGAPAITQIRMSVNGIEIPNRLEGASLPAVCPRRGPFDKILVDAAREAGAEVREGFQVRELVRGTDGAITGITGTVDGVNVTETARIVIGADGRNSFVARAVEAEEYNVRPLHTCGGYTYYEGIGHDGVAELHLKGRRMMFFFPTDNGQVCVGTEWPLDEHDEFRKGPEGSLMKTLALIPGLAEKVSRGHPVERFHGLVLEKAYFRTPYGPGWALVGDAGYVKDPVTGLGMADAFRDVELLVDALCAGLAGHLPMDEALAGYQQKRDEASKLMYEVTYQLATLEPPEGLVQMMAAGA